MNDQEFQYRLETVKKEWVELTTAMNNGYMLTSKQQRRWEYLRILIMKYV
jgi:hypothetical protein